mgnify:CR=1 FL=1
MWLCHTWGESSKERPSFVFGLFDEDLFFKSDDFSIVDNETGCAISRGSRQQFIIGNNE